MVSARRQGVGPFEVAVVLAWLAIVAIGWAGYHLLLQNGRLLLRIEELEQQVGEILPASADAAATPADQSGPDEPWPDDESEPHFGLPVGTVLHEFELPDLDGRQHLRSAWLGQRWLLTFVNPACPHSRRLLADLARLQPASSPEWPHPVLVSTGSSDENRRLMTESGLACTVLLQEEMEVGALFEVDRTPMAYLVDEDGRTVSPLVAGRVAIVGLAASAGLDSADSLPVEPPSMDLIELGTSPAPVNGARYQHDGLGVGAVAPCFRLPGLDGGEIALSDYRGRRVLLAFADPICPPCDLVASALERLHLESHRLSVLIVARGGAEANRAWMAEHGLTAPVALQPRWDLSRAYGILATPVAYLLDEDGTVAAPVALGANAILDLIANEA
jgi:peroxiredoxin